ncbi:uncharacterized protein LOC135101694 [Scylla paramamosain]|uniref:uncharacterized protein LOC135101694 n=1 Tax=Scylla paramamosain TaxID=85552 RepID=UPI003083E7A0
MVGGWWERRSSSGCVALNITSIQVPPQVKAGDPVKLHCHFDLEGDKLYSVTWWREQEMFYQFTPASTKMKTIYDRYGIHVNEAQSNITTVVLQNVTHATAGEYMCEVVADHPTFEKDSQLRNMEVIDVPDRFPVLQVSRTEYSRGDQLVANCTSPGARPAPQLEWLINGDMVSKQHSQLVSEGSSVMGLLSPTSELRLRLTDRHFKEGRLQLTCRASLGPLYEQNSDVLLSVPGKTAAPSQKLYGAGSVVGANLVMFFLTCLVTLFLLVM